MTSPTATNPVDQLTRALGATERLVTAVGDDHGLSRPDAPAGACATCSTTWSAATWRWLPCSPGRHPRQRRRPPRRRPDRRLPAVRRGVAGGLRPALRARRGRHRPRGDGPRRRGAAPALTEILVHGWDLVRATGQPTTGLPADLAEQELACRPVAS